MYEYARGIMHPKRKILAPVVKVVVMALVVVVVVMRLHAPHLSDVGLATHTDRGADAKPFFNKKYLVL